MSWKSWRTRTRRSEDASRSDTVIPLINDVLPREMLERIFSHLAPKDLKTVMLICKTWNNAADTPALWSWVDIRFRDQLRLKRLQGAQEISVGGVGGVSERILDWILRDLMRDIIQHPGLKKIILTKHINIRGPPKAVDAELLTQVFAKMEEIQIHDFKWAEMHPTKCLVDAVLNRPNKLKKLVLIGRMGVDPVLLLTALNKIEILEVSLSKDEVNKLFKMMQDGTSVTSLSLLKTYTLSELEPSYICLEYLTG